MVPTSFEFSNQVNDISTSICSFFDELMVLYRLVGVRENTVISLDKDEPEVTFNSIMESDEEAASLYNSFNGTDFSVYGSKFDIKMNLRKNIVSTLISKAIY